MTSRDGTDHVYLLNLDELTALVREHLTCWFTDEESYQYHHLDAHPPR